jgi:D-glycero-D-manno-heptose 1,7-bisphosphate phosphatase
MLEKIIAKHSVLLNDSFLIGDSIRDIEAAEKVGLRGIKIVANSNLNTLISL